MGQKKQKCQVSLLLQFVVGLPQKWRRMTGLKTMIIYTCVNMVARIRLVYPMENIVTVHFLHLTRTAFFCDVFCHSYYAGKRTTTINMELPSTTEGRRASREAHRSPRTCRSAAVSQAPQVAPAGGPD